MESPAVAGSTSSEAPGETALVARNRVAVPFWFDRAVSSISNIVESEISGRLTEIVGHLGLRFKGQYASLRTHGATQPVGECTFVSTHINDGVSRRYTSADVTNLLSFDFEAISPSSQ